MKDTLKKVLFICTHNSARSHIAEGLLNHYGGNLYEAKSAGTEATAVNPFSIKVMEEIGIDMSGHYSKTLDNFLADDFDYVITVCDRAKEACPYFPGGKNIIHKGFEDPSVAQGSNEEIEAVFRRVRDEIMEWIEEVFL